MDADVIVVGGGPAGSTCTRLLARRGYRVILLDRSRFPRGKPCGGWVNVKAFEDFPELDRVRRKASVRNRLVETGFRGLVFHSPDFRREAVYRSRSVSGYTVLRDRFDQALVKMAAEAGSQVRVLQRKTVEKVEVREDSVAVACRGGPRYEARVIVGADGADSTVARQTGLREAWPTERLITCREREIAVDGRTIDRLYGKQRRIHVAIAYRGIVGYAWAFPKRNTVNVGVGRRGEAGEELDEVFAHWVADLRDAELLPKKATSGKPRRGILPAAGAIEYEGHVGKGVLLIGDAGGFVSSASGEGIYPAMLSARTAAGCIDDALAGGRGQDALLEFKIVWRRDFAEYIQMPNANLALLLPLIYDNPELCNRLARCFLFGENF